MKLAQIGLKVSIPFIQMIIYCIKIRSKVWLEMGSLWMSKQKWANFLCTCPSPLLGEIKPPTALKYTPRNILNIRMDSSISSFVACLLPIPSVCGYVSFISISMVKNVSLILLLSFIKVYVLLLVNYEDEA